MGKKWADRTKNGQTWPKGSKNVVKIWRVHSLHKRPLNNQKCFKFVPPLIFEVSMPFSHLLNLDIYGPNRKLFESAFLPWVTTTRLSRREGRAMGKSSQRTAKWSYLDHPVKTKPRKLSLLVLNVSRLMTSNQARLFPTCLCTFTAYNRSPKAPTRKKDSNLIDLGDQKVHLGERIASGFLRVTSQFRSFLFTDKVGLTAAR